MNTAFIYNVIEASKAGHDHNVTCVEANGLLSRAWVKPGIPKNWVGEHILERTDGLFNIYRRGELQAVAETLEAARKHDSQLCNEA